jgi:hypothetical protein
MTVRDLRLAYGQSVSWQVNNYQLLSEDKTLLYIMRSVPFSLIYLQLFFSLSSSLYLLLFPFLSLCFFLSFSDCTGLQILALQKLFWF